MRYSKFITKDGFANLHPIKGTRWLLYLNQYRFDSYGCPPSQILTNYTIKWNTEGLFFEQRIQTSYSYCATSCLLVLYLKKRRYI